LTMRNWSLRWSASRRPSSPLSPLALDILRCFSNFLHLPGTFLTFSTFEFARFARLYQFHNGRPLTFSQLQPTFRVLLQATSALPTGFNIK
jgi:hypothetical protein